MTLYRVRKCMRGLGVRGVTPNAKKRITIPDEGAPPKPDLVARDFTSPVPTYKLAGDITYLRTGQGWLFLATVIDLNTRMVVGWACVWAHGRRHSRLGLGLARRRGYVAEGPSSTATAAASTPRGRCVVGRGKDVRPSCGVTGSCHGNAPAESFFATLRSEMYCRRPSPRARRRGSP